VRSAALIGLVASLLLAGCSLGGDEEPRPATGATKQVAEAVGSLDQAIRRRDFRTICDRLFTVGARRRAGGRDCPRLLRSTVAGLKRPSIRIVGIELTGAKAKVRVQSRAAGQRSLADTINLVRQGARYRVEALAD
jgi:hypothetical protein